MSQPLPTCNTLLSEIESFPTSLHLFMSSPSLSTMPFDPWFPSMALEKEDYKLTIFLSLENFQMIVLIGIIKFIFLQRTKIFEEPIFWATSCFLWGLKNQKSIRIQSNWANCERNNIVNMNLIQVSY